MRSSYRVWFILVLGLVFLCIQHASEFSDRATVYPPQHSFRLQPTATPTPTPLPFPTPFVYPLAARYKIESLFDHDDPDLNPDDDLIVYTGAAVHNDAGGDDDCCWQDQNTEIWVCSYKDTGENWFDLRWDQDNEGDCTELGGAGWLFYDGHTGYDMSCDNGTPVNAAGQGRVGLEGNDTIFINHGWLSYRTYYRHLQNRIPGPLTPVVPGEHIGETGLGHLHFEVKRYVDGDWRYIDPSGWEGAGDDPLTYDVGNLWLGDIPVNPIPMGYRDQNNNLDPDSPFAVSDSNILTAWMAQAGDFGSPIENKYDFYTPLCFTGRQPPPRQCHRATL